MKKEIGKDKFNIISGDKIKHFMDINGFTAEKIAEELGKQKRTYFYKIKGDTEFTANEVWILTKLFDCTLDDLVKDTNNMTKFEKLRYEEVSNKEITTGEAKRVLAHNSKAPNSSDVTISKEGKFNIISGDKIKYFMDINGFTAEKIAEELGKEKRTYFYKAKGDTEFTASEIWVLTKLFDCTLDDLIKEICEMNEYERTRCLEVSNKK